MAIGTGPVLLHPDPLVRPPWSPRQPTLASVKRANPVTGGRMQFLDPLSQPSDDLFAPGLVREHSHLCGARRVGAR
jgi:hypothetical protein